MGLLHFLFADKEKERINELESQINSYKNIHPEIAHLYNVPYEESGLTYKMSKIEYLQANISSIKHRLKYNAMREQERTEWYKKFKEQQSEIDKRNQVYSAKYNAERKHKNQERAKYMAEQQEIAKRKAKKFRKKLDNLSSMNGKFTPQEIINIAYTNSFSDFTGIYIIINEDINMVYVGQSKKVIKRLVQHFEGSGCSDVYVDYRHNATQSIQTLSLAKSGYESLDKLEKDYISRYNSFVNGYNKTKGNHN